MMTRRRRRLPSGWMRSNTILLLLTVGNNGGLFAAAFHPTCLLPAVVLDQPILVAWDNSSAAAAASLLSADELFFAAANLMIDLQQQTFSTRWTKQGLSATTRTRSTVYDYDTQPVSSTISLTKEEKDLFKLVKDIRDEFCPNTTIRVAGGWVRDKLLGKKTTHDIDFVLNDTSGSDFAKLFHRYCMEHYPEEKTDIYFQCKGSNGKTKSKHLQTASIQFRDFRIDFCHLRYEKYNPDSRVPEETKMAPPVQDAWRRDLTINSLFYNVNTNQVEDWTEQGLQDLQLGIIATPAVMPLATVLEDPLRILRAIRFVAQLEFSMDPNLKKAAMDPRVGRALQQKVSRDRIGNEMDSIFLTRDPARGVKLLLDTNLMGAVFPLEKFWNMEESSSLSSPLNIYEAGFRLLSRTQSLVSRIFVRASQWDESRRRYLWYAALLKPCYDMQKTCSSLDGRGGGKRSRRDGSILYQLLTPGLKRPACDTRSIENIIQGADRLQTFLENHGQSATLLEKVDFTISEHDPRWAHIADLRWAGYNVLKEIGPFWKESLILAQAKNEQQGDIAENVKQYRQWLTFIVDQLGLGDAIFDKGYSKPMLNGSQIQQRALPGAHGEIFKRIMRAQEEWQVRHGCSGADAENTREAELIAYLVDTFPEYANHAR